MFYFSFKVQQIQCPISRMLLRHSQVMASFQPSSMLPSPVSWSAALQPRNLPESWTLGMKTIVLKVTFPSGLVWKKNWNKSLHIERTGGGRTLHNQNSEISSVNGTPAFLVSNNSRKYELNVFFARGGETKLTQTDSR